GFLQEPRTSKQKKKKPLVLFYSGNLTAASFRQTELWSSPEAFDNLSFNFRFSEIQLILGFIFLLVNLFSNNKTRETKIAVILKLRGTYLWRLDYSAHFTLKDSEMAHHMLRPNDLRDSSIDPLGRDVVPLRSRAYGLDDISGFSARSEPALGGLTAGMSARGYTSSLEDPILFSQRRDVPLGISPVPPGNPDIIYERPNSQRRVESLSLHETESNILFVDGLPTDCTRREVGRYKFDDKKPESSILRIHFAHFPFRLPSQT
uniref:Uncharacterized protein n=1 Tax=Chenopodium quinoa TaxID=63459 RepID=A0A803L4H1_CHEQI